MTTATTAPIALPTSGQASITYPNNLSDFAREVLICNNSPWLVVPTIGGVINAGIPPNTANVYAMRDVDAGQAIILQPVNPTTVTPSYTPSAWATFDTNQIPGTWPAQIPPTNLNTSSGGGGGGGTPVFPNYIQQGGGQFANTSGTTIPQSTIAALFTTPPAAGDLVVVFIADYQPSGWILSTIGGTGWTTYSGVANASGYSGIGMAAKIYGSSDVSGSNPVTVGNSTGYGQFDTYMAVKVPAADLAASPTITNGGCSSQTTTSLTTGATVSADSIVLAALPAFGKTITSAPTVSPGQAWLESGTASYNPDLIVLGQQVSSGSPVWTFPNPGSGTINNYDQSPYLIVPLAA